MTEWIYDHFSDFTTEINLTFGHLLVLLRSPSLPVTAGVLPGGWWIYAQVAMFFLSQFRGRSANYRIMTSKQTFRSLPPTPALSSGAPVSGDSWTGLPTCQVVRPSDFQLTISFNRAAKQQMNGQTHRPPTDQPSPDSRQTTEKLIVFRYPSPTMTEYNIIIIPFARQHPWWPEDYSGLMNSSGNALELLAAAVVAPSAVLLLFLITWQSLCAMAS